VLDVGERLGVYVSNPEPYLPAKEEGRGRTPIRYKSEQNPILLKNHKVRSIAKCNDTG